VWGFLSEPREDVVPEMALSLAKRRGRQTGSHILTPLVHDILKRLTDNCWGNTATFEVYRLHERLMLAKCEAL
jgi:hypothetical protein